MYVYRHIRLDKNEPFYIGVGTKKSNVNFTSLNTEYGRAFDKRITRRNGLWAKIVNKTSYIVEILMDDLLPQDAAVKEREFIKLYGRINNKTGVLANLSDGGEGNIGYVVSDETKEKIRIKLKGNKNGLGNIVSPESRKRASEQLKNNKIALGHKHTEDHKEKNRQARLGKKHSEETKNKLKEKRKNRAVFRSGFTLPQTTKDKISAALKGVKFSEERKQNMRGKRGEYKKRNKIK